MIIKVKGDTRIIKAEKGMFVGVDEEGELIFATNGLNVQEMIKLSTELMQYAMIRISTDKILNEIIQDEKE